MSCKETGMCKSAAACFLAGCIYESEPIKCLRDERLDQNMQGPCSAGRCEWPNCREPASAQPQPEAEARTGVETAHRNPVNTHGNS